MNWRPRLDSQIDSLPPYTNLSIRGRIAFAAIPLLFGLTDIVGALLGLSNWSKNNFYFDYLGYPLVDCLLILISGILLTLLTIDFVAVGAVLRRHRLEFFCFVFISVIQSLYSLLFDTSNILYGEIATNTSVIPSLRYLVFTILGVYVAFRLLSGRKILVKNTFLLLSAFFWAELLTLLYYNIQNWQDYVVVNRVAAVLQWGVYGVAAFFFLRTYLELRRRPMFELSLPVYVRGIVFLYGGSSLFFGVFELFFSSPVTNFENFGGVVSFSLIVALTFMLAVSYIFASFHSLRFSVGEAVKKVDGMEL